MAAVRAPLRFGCVAASEKREMDRSSGRYGAFMAMNGAVSKSLVLYVRVDRVEVREHAHAFGRLFECTGPMIIGVELRVRAEQRWSQVQAVAANLVLPFGAGAISRKAFRS